MSFDQFMKRIATIRKQRWEFLWCFDRDYPNGWKAKVYCGTLSQACAKMRKFIDRHELVIDLDEEAEAVGRKGDRAFVSLMSFENPLRKFI